MVQTGPLMCLHSRQRDPVAQPAVSITKGKERSPYTAHSLLSPLPRFSFLVSWLCAGVTSSLQTESSWLFSLVSGWVNEEGEGGFWKVKGKSTGLSLPCSPLSFHQHVSTCKCDLHDQGSLRRPLLHGFCSQGAWNTIFSPNPFNGGFPSLLVSTSLLLPCLFP